MNLNISSGRDQFFVMGSNVMDHLKAHIYMAADDTITSLHVTDNMPISSNLEFRITSRLEQTWNITNNTAPLSDTNMIFHWIPTEPIAHWTQPFIISAENNNLLELYFSVTDTPLPTHVRCTSNHLTMNTVLLSSNNQSDYQTRSISISRNRIESFAIEVTGQPFNEDSSVIILEDNRFHYAIITAGSIPVSLLRNTVAVAFLTKVRIHIIR